MTTCRHCAHRVSGWELRLDGGDDDPVFAFPFDATGRPRNCPACGCPFERPLNDDGKDASRSLYSGAYVVLNGVILTEENSRAIITSDVIQVSSTSGRRSER